MNKKVLIITYYWPPSGGAGVQRWLKFAKYLPEFGWEPHIYTPLNPEAPAQDFSLEKDIPSGVVVVKKKIFEPYSFYKKFTGKKGNVNAGFLSEDKDSRKKFTEKISVWIRGNLFIPDARVMWVKPSVRFLKKYIKDNDINIVVSTGPPHSMHLIAMNLNNTLNIKWIADFRDPWTNIDFYKDLMLSHYSDRKHHRLEKQVLQSAGEVVTIGNTMASELEAVRGSKVRVITNGYDGADFRGLKPQPDSEIFNITHVGSINTDRNHRIFWDALSQLSRENKDFNKKLRLTFVGKLDYSVYEDLEKSGLKEKTKIVSYVPHNEIVNYLFRANCLYLPLNNTPNAKGVLSGKFFEYLATGIPIAGIGHPTGDAADIMKETKAGEIVGFNDVKAFKTLIFQMFKGDFPEPDNNLREKYSRFELTKKLTELF